MAEGIMGLAPGMGAPATPQQAPQELDPKNLQVFMDTFSSMDPAEFEGQVDEAIGEIDPALAQQIQADLSAIQVTLEEKEALLEMINFVLSNPQSYDQVRIQGIEMGLPEEFFPEEFDLEFFSTLRYVIVRLPVQQAEPPVQGFRNGGPVSLKPIAQFLASQGRGGDTILAHINSKEAAMLRRMGGAGTINPITGLREYKDPVKSLKKLGSNIVAGVKKVIAPVINVTKKLLSNPIVRVVATAAAVYFSGGTATALLGAGAAKTAAGIAAGAAINSTAVNLLAGDKPKDALKAGLMVGVTSGAGAYFGGMPLTQSTPDVILTNPFTGSQSTVRGLGKGALDAVNPFSSSTPTVTADTEFAKLTGKGLPADAQTYRLATEAAKTANASTILGMTTPQAITAAATVVPPILSYMGQPKPPKPEDLNIPGVGGPTGADLLNQDPSGYGVNIGGTSSTYTDPYAGLANTSAMQIGNSSEAPASVPGAPLPLPGAPSTPFATINTPMPGSEAYEQMFSGYDPTKDPMNPAYNPFSSPTQVAAAPSNLTGGFNTSQGFAQGGIATLAKGGSVKKSDIRMRQEAAQERQRQEIASKYGESSDKPKSQEELFRESNVSRAAQERARQRTSAEQQKRVDSVLNSAQKAAQEGRPLNFGPGYANEQGLYRQAIESAKKSNPTNFMTPNEAEAYVAQQRIANLAKEKTSFEQSQAQAIALAKRNEEALAAKQKAEKELTDFEAYKASILGPGASTQPVTSAGGGGTLPVTPPANITLGGAGNPTAGMSNTGPSVPGVPEISIGAGAPAIPAVMVYGPDGTPYGSPSAAITAGVFNYSMSPPAAGGIGSFVAPNISAPSVNFGSSPTMGFNSAPAISPTNVPSAFGTGSTVGFGSGNTAGAFGSGSMTNAFGTQPQITKFAGGGIAAMAPYRFSRGTNPTQQYPRRTGPINGPGTGTSDSIPAMLSDGEFVFTAKAVRNMGGGSRLDGAKKMYKMMKMLEGKS